jgi:hypothetical protein
MGYLSTDLFTMPEDLLEDKGEDGAATPPWVWSGHRLRSPVSAFLEVFKLKKVKLDPTHPAIGDMVRYADRGEGIDHLNQLLAKGLKINDQENGGCSMIQRLLEGIDMDFSFYTGHRRNGRDKLNSERPRDKIKAIHLFAKHGARWVPEN